MTIDEIEQQTEPTDLTTRQRFVGGASCCTSGVALVIHIITGSPLWLVFTVSGFIGAASIAIVSVRPAGSFHQFRWLLKRGVLAGLAGTAAYDAARWVLVQLGGLELSPFEALPLFGRALLGEGRPGLAVQVAGVGYHLLNGVLFGVVFVIWFGRRHWAWGIMFALGLEAFMLALYPGWLDPKSIAELAQVSMVGHFAYGATLGLTSKALLGGKPQLARQQARRG